MALVERQTLSQREASIDATIISGVPNANSAADFREIMHQDSINAQAVFGFIGLAGSEPTVTINDTTSTVVPIGNVSGGEVDSVASISPLATVEIVASATNHTMTSDATASMLYEVSGSINIEPPAGPSLITCIVETFDGAVWTPTTFVISAVQELGKSFTMVIPSFEIVLDNDDAVRIVAITDNVTPELCTVKQGFLKLKLIPYGT